jgi:septation ring formation regulator EzrA
MKALINEISGLRKESNEANRSAETARSQNQFIVRNMKQHLETLKSEKQRMANQMKEEAQRVREQIAGFQREIQALRRQERKLTDSLNRLEKQCSTQASVIT